MRFAPFLPILILLVVSCGEDNFLDGIDRQALFAEPTQTELADIKADWQSRNLQPTDYEITQEWEVIPKVLMKIVTYRVNNLKQYALLVVPSANEPMPVRMYFSGFGIDNIVNAIELRVDETTFEKPYVFAFPALRGQGLKITINDVTYTTLLSEGEHCDAFDGATDDGIALLNLIDTYESMADVTRTSVRGGSRGGTVALLMAERDSRVKMAFDVAGPTNLLSLTAKNENDRTYRCQFLDALVNGSMTQREARHRLIASSPFYFAESLPATQLHLGEKDTIVPVEQGNLLKDKMNGLNHDDFELYVYPDRGHSDIVTENTELNSRIERLLQQL